tara:strand:+ start:2857 stop:3435 length:579 start_codon:yes stop_codon:yes gene_type:complete
MRFIKNFILLIVFCCLIASFFITKEKKLEKTEIKTQSKNFNINIKSNDYINKNEEEKKEVNNFNKINIEKEKEIKKQIEEEYLKTKEFSKEVAKVVSNSTKKAFLKTITGFPSSYRPTEEFINIVNSYQGEFVPLDTLPETNNLCFDSNYQQYSFGIITIVNNNGIKEVYECVYTAENSGKWVYRGLANNQN